MSDWQARVAVVERENDILRERIAALESVLGMVMEVPVALGIGLTPTEGKILGMLLTRDFVPREAIHVALYQSRPDADSVPELKIIDVLICKIRAKLKGLCNARIETKVGEGYYIRPPEKDALRAALASRAA